MRSSRASGAKRGSSDASERRPRAAPASRRGPTPRRESGKPRDAERVRSPRSPSPRSARAERGRRPTKPRSRPPATRPAASAAPEVPVGNSSRPSSAGTRTARQEDPRRRPTPRARSAFPTVDGRARSRPPTRRSAAGEEQQPADRVAGRREATSAPTVVKARTNSRSRWTGPAVSCAAAAAGEDPTTEPIATGGHLIAGRRRRRAIPAAPASSQPQRDVGGLDGVADHAAQVGVSASRSTSSRRRVPNASSVRAAS